MPCLLVFLALFAPRLVIVLTWLLSRWFNGLFSSALLPVLGFVFAPTTFLWYTAVLHWWAGQWTLWPIVGLVLALMVDGIVPASRGRRRRRSTAG